MSGTGAARVEGWTWADPIEGPERLRRELATRGLARVRPGVPALAPEEAGRSPWAFAAQLLGVRPLLVERQPIKAVPGGRSFASSDAETPLHSDSQLFAGAPPHLQIMACVRAADRGGTCLFVDTWPLIEAIAREDPELYRLLFERFRRVPFVFGDVFGPTVAWRGGATVFTHSPARSRPEDRVAERLARRLEAWPPIELDVAAGEIVIADNHRMLHGRRAFAGPRAFVRLLVWLPAPIAPSPFEAEARRIAGAASQPLRGADEAVRRRFGLGEEPPVEARRRLALVLEMLQGTAPGVIAARERVPEPELYRWRDRALAAAERALASDDPASDAAMSAVMETISGGTPPRR